MNENAQGTGTEEASSWIRPYRDAVVLVTGGNGFIGSCIVQRLLGARAKVHVLSRRALPSGDVEVHAGDIADREFVQEAIRSIQPDYVFHLAGRTNAAKELKHVVPTFETNAMGTVNVLVSAADSAPDCSVVACASMEELWNDEIRASSPYAVSKRVASTYVAMFKALHGLQAVSLRTFFVYGPGPQSSDKLMPHVLQALREHRPPALRSPNRSMDWVYVDDVAEAFLRAGLSKTAAAHAEPIDIGSGSLHTIGEVARTLARLMGSRVDLRHLEKSDGALQVSPVADIGTAQRLLGWRAQTELGAGLERLVAWCRNQLREA